MDKKELLISAYCVFRKDGRKMSWFLIKDEESGEWGIPRTTVRKGESSVRASIRSAAEEGGMRAKVLEEVGRAGGATKHKGEIVTQRTYFYLLVYKEGDEVLGFVEAGWFDHTKAVRKVASKRDNQMLKDAKALVVRLEAERGKKYLSGIHLLEDGTEED